MSDDLEQQDPAPDEVDEASASFSQEIEVILVAEADDATEHVRQDVDAIRTILRKTDRRRRSAQLVEVALWSAVALAAVMISALLLALCVAAEAPEIAPLAARVGVIAAVAVALVIAAAILWRRHDAVAVAIDLQDQHRAFRNDIVAALEFAGWLGEAPSASHPGGAFSPVLARAHLHRTARMLLGEARQGHLAHVVAQHNVRPALYTLAMSIVMVVLPLALAPQWTVGALRGGASLNAESVQAAELLVRPIVGSINLTLNYPKHTGKPTHFEPMTTGHVVADAGTEVILQSYPLLAAKSVEMVMTTKEGPRRQAMEHLASGALRTSFVATEAMSYHFRAQLPDGTFVEDGVERQIKVIPDKPPEVLITSHSGEIEVSPQDILTLKFDVTDDFGVASVTRIHQFSQEEEQGVRQELDLPELVDNPRSLSGQVQLDLQALNLQPKDRVFVTIESSDNNTLTGPGVSRSEPLILRVSSPEDKHFANIAEQQQVVEALLLWLADTLEAPLGERVKRKDDSYSQVVARDLGDEARVSRFKRARTAHDNGAAVLKRMAEVAERLKDDPLMVERDRTIFAAIQKQLATIHDQGALLFASVGKRLDAGTLDVAALQVVANHAATIEDALEKGVLQLQDVLASQKMSAVRAMADDIDKLKGRLRELLEQYRDSKDPELREAIKREVQRLRQRLSEMMARMQDQMQRLPAEHVNLEALEQAAMEDEASKMAENFKSIEDMLDADDIDGALAALDRMGQNLDALTQDMDQQFAANQPEGLNKLDKAMSELMDQVGDLQSEQREIEERTAEAQRSMAEQRRKAAEEMLEGFDQKMLDQIGAQRKELDKLERSKALGRRDRVSLDMAKRALERMKQMVEQRDMDQALSEARDSVDALERLRAGLELSMRYRPGRQSRQLRQDLKAVDEGTSRGEGMVKELEGLMNKARRELERGNAERLSELAKRQRAANKRARKLRQSIKKKSKEFSMLEQQLAPKLDEARQHMEGAGEALGKGRAQSALDGERKAIESLDRLREQMKDTLRKERQRQQRGNGSKQLSEEKVVIPEQPGEPADSAFRKQMQDAMKEGRLDDYASEIEKYYKSLAE